MVGLVSTAGTIVCTVKSKSVPVGTDGSVVEDTMDKPGKFRQHVKMLAPSPPIYIGGLEFLAPTVIEVQKASTSIERMGVEKANPLILAGVSDMLASIVDGSMGMFPHTNSRAMIHDIVVGFFVEAPLKM
jgi:hypothetical protein